MFRGNYHQKLLGTDFNADLLAMMSWTTKDPELQRMLFGD